MKVFIVFAGIVGLFCLGATKPARIRQIEPEIRYVYVALPIMVEVAFHPELGYGFALFSQPMQQVAVVLKPNDDANVVAILDDGSEQALFGTPDGTSWTLTLLEPKIVEVIVHGTAEPLRVEARNFE